MKTFAREKKRPPYIKANRQYILSSALRLKRQDREINNILRPPHDKQSGIIRLKAENPDSISSDLGQGKPLSNTEQDYFGPRFGYDFSAVRIHNDSKSADLAESIDAKAFTTGTHVALGKEGVSGSQRKHLLAHELTHVVQQNSRPDTTPGIQRRRAGKSPVPGVNRTKFNLFFVDLKKAMKTALGRTMNLQPSNYMFLTPAKLLADAKTNSPKIYKEAYKDAKATCSQSVLTYCKGSASCAKKLRAIRTSRIYCTKTGLPTKLLISIFLPHGFTLPGSGKKSRVNIGKSKNETLETIIHEGIHRLQGKEWQKRCTIRGYNLSTNQMIRLRRIAEKMDEGVVQILTKKVIAAMKNISGRSWYSGYTSSMYQAEMNYVKGILTKHGKTDKYLIKAFFSAGFTKEAENLQHWQ